MNSPNNNFGLSSDEQTKAAALGQKLAYFVASLSATPEEKLEIIDLIQEMTLSQMEKLSQLVDEFYTESKTEVIEEKMKKALLAVKKDFEKKNEKTDTEFSEKLRQMEEELKK
ncbi:MAG TPA: hypothetical protein P5230_00825 [Candidatus Magasanikbacteria bacterium]|nr:hypothetical protein [Candidatus Magasanikbacteria bacterium]